MKKSFQWTKLKDLIEIVSNLTRDRVAKKVSNIGFLLKNKSSGVTSGIKFFYTLKKLAMHEQSIPLYYSVVFIDNFPEFGLIRWNCFFWVELHPWSCLDNGSYGNGYLSNGSNEYNNSVFSLKTDMFGSLLALEVNISL